MTSLPNAPLRLFSVVCRATKSGLPILIVAGLALLLPVLIPAAAGEAQDSPREMMRRADAALWRGEIDEAVTGFDRVIALVPEYGPELWQRGIALYYAGRFEDCRAQFESHRLVNPNDVENAAWHFLCVAQASSRDAAVEALLPVGPDRRVPMREVYEMFAGRATPDEVLAAAGSTQAGTFYGQLYVGLYLEAVGEEDRALTHLAIAASDRFAAMGGYMYQVARLHLTLREGR